MKYGRASPNTDKLRILFLVLPFRFEVFSIISNQKIHSLPKLTNVKLE